jgi:hypothetical protein
MASRVSNPTIPAFRLAIGECMNATIPTAPFVEFFSGRQEAYVGVPGLSWRRVTPKEAAHSFTGRDRDSHEPRVGVFIAALPGDIVRIGFDLMRLDVNLTESTRERLHALYATRSAKWSKAELRRTRDRVHFSKSFAEFVVREEHVNVWKDELAQVLSDPGSFEAI